MKFEQRYETSVVAGSICTKPTGKCTRYRNWKSLWRWSSSACRYAVMEYNASKMLYIEMFLKLIRFTAVFCWNPFDVLKKSGNFSAIWGKLFIGPTSTRRLSDASIIMSFQLAKYLFKSILFRDFQVKDRAESLIKQYRPSLIISIHRISVEKLWDLDALGFAEVFGARQSGGICANDCRCQSSHLWVSSRLQMGLSSARLTL